MYRKIKKLNFIKEIALNMMIIIGAALIICGCDRSEEVTLSSEAIENETSEILTNEQDDIFVYITGEIKNPGVYAFAKDARLYQVIEKAGGMTKKAKKDYLNLAEVVTDGQKIKILSAKEYKKINKDSGINTDGAVQTSEENKSELININLAKSEELQQLSGIGETRALAIIAYREENGKFNTIEELKNVSGIGDATFEKLKSQISV